MTKNTPWNASPFQGKIKAPCKDCPNRKLGCRSECEAWAEHERIKQAVYAERMKEWEGTYVSHAFRYDKYTGMFMIKRKEKRR